MNRRAAHIIRQRKGRDTMRNKASFKLALSVLVAALLCAALAPGGLPGALSARAERASGGKRPTVLLILDGFGLSD